MAAHSVPDVDVVTVSGPAAAGQSYLEWGPVVAGAIAAAAISFLLLSFGGAIGLSMTSPWPYAGASALAVTVAVAWWTVMVEIGSFAAGGYLAGRLRSRWLETGDEARFRDGAHGFMVWAVGIVIGAILLGMAAGATLQTAVQSLSQVAGATGAAAVSSDSEDGGAGPIDYAVDSLLRMPATPAPSTGAAGQPASTGAQQPAASNDLRRETARIFASAVTNRELTAADRDYLAQLVAQRTGMPPAEAQKRVDDTIAELARLETEARRQLDKARKAAIIAGFIAAASLLAACAAACAGAALGGRHRDAGNAPRFFGTHLW